MVCLLLKVKEIMVIKSVQALLKENNLLPASLNDIGCCSQVSANQNRVLLSEVDQNSCGNASEPVNYLTDNQCIFLGNIPSMVADDQVGSAFTSFFEDADPIIPRIEQGRHQFGRKYLPGSEMKTKEKSSICKSEWGSVFRS